jgi:hypothetical protein
MRRRESVVSISSISSTNTLLKQLEAGGLSASTAKLVDKDLEAAASAAQGAATATTPVASVREALNAKIDADVSSGKISVGDAAKVKNTLDNIDAQSSGSGITSQGAQPTPTPAATTASGDAVPGHGGGGGGGGGGGATKTEVSETVTVAGSTMTTIITYTDGTSETTTTTATAADIAKYGNAAATDATNSAASAYLSTIDKGSLIDLSA